MLHEDSRHHEIIARKLNFKPKRIFDNTDNSFATNGSEAHFLMSLFDMDEMLAFSGEYTPANVSKGVYNLTRVSAILRQMLVDDGGSIPRLFKQYGIQPEFNIHLKDLKDLLVPNQKSTFLVADLSVTRFPWKSSVKVDFKRFLHTTCVVLGGSKFSVKDVIKVIANGKNGVHGKLKSSEVELKKLLDFDDTHRSTDVDICLSVLAHIGSVVVDALVPLVDTMKKRADDK